MTKNYSPRRQTARWLDGDCPQGVLCILDAGPSVNDRWTVVYADPVRAGSFAQTVLGYRGMCDTPFAPHGVGMYGELDAYQVAALRRRQRSAKWSALPEDCKRAVRNDLES
jgi:hypothetical protein